MPDARELAKKRVLDILGEIEKILSEVFGAFSELCDLAKKAGCTGSEQEALDDKANRIGGLVFVAKKYPSRKEDFLEFLSVTARIQFENACQALLRELGDEREVAAVEAKVQGMQYAKIIARIRALRAGLDQKFTEYRGEVGRMSTIRPASE